MKYSNYDIQSSNGEKFVQVKYILKCDDDFIHKK